MKKVNLKEKVKQLKKYFQKKPEVLMAYVFGSYAQGREISESDFDCAVYFKPENNQLEYEQEIKYPQEDKIWSEVEDIVKRPTDLVVLNRAPSTLAFEILATGKPIIIRDRGLWMDFYLIVSSVAEDFREFIKDFWRIEQRSTSLSETDKSKLIKRIKFLDNELSSSSLFEGLNLRTYTDDHLKRLSVERWIENIVNASIDISKIFLASQKKKMPETYKKIFSEISFFAGFDQDTVSQLSEFSSLRNFLAHEYLDLRFEKIKNFLEKAEPVYKKLIGFVNRLLEQEEGKTE